MPARVSVASGVPVVMATVTAAVLARIVVTGTGMADFSVPWNIAAMCIPAVLIGGQIAPLINRHLNPNRIKLMDRPWVIGHSGEGIRPHAASAT